MSTLVTIYWCCFGVGLVYMLVMGALGMIGGGIESDGDADFDLDHDLDAHLDFDIAGDLDAGADMGGDLDLDADLDVDAVDADIAVGAGHDHDTGIAAHHGIGEGLSTYNPLSLTSIMASMTAFGAGGLAAIAMDLPVWTGVVAALLAGGLISFLYYLLIGKLLYSMQGTSNARQSDMIGIEAEVLVPFEDEISGEIAYILDGVRYTAPARLRGEGHVNRQEKVRIRGIKDNIVYVDQKRKLLN